MKVFKIFGGVFTLLLAIVIAAAIYFYTNINEIIKRVVETTGPEITQTSVRLRDVDVKPFEGSGQLKNFVVGNPPGFDSEYALKWDTVGVQIDPASLSGEVVLINEVTIQGVQIIAEQKGYTTNIQTLLNTLSGDAKAPESSDKKDPGSDVRLALKRLDFSDNAVQFVTEKFGSHTVSLPSFSLANIGDPKTGLTPAEMGEAVMTPLLKQAKIAVEEKVKSMGKEELNALLGDKKSQLKAKVDAKKDELKSKLDDEGLEEKESELKDKLKKEEEKLKKLFK